MSDEFRSDVSRIYDKLFGEFISQVSKNRNFDGNLFQASVLDGGLVSKDSRNNFV